MATAPQTSEDDPVEVEEDLTEATPQRIYGPSDRPEAEVAA